MNMISPSFFLKKTINSKGYIGLPKTGVAYVCFHRSLIRCTQEKHDLVEIDFPHGDLYRDVENKFWILCGANHPSRASMAAEALYTLGVETTKAFGVAGGIDETLEEDRMYQISRAISLDGLAKLYGLPDEIKIDSNTQSTIGVASISNIYRETKDLIKDLKTREVSFIDMESYAFFAAAEFYKRKHEHNLVVSDTLTSDGWQFNETMFSKALQVVSDSLEKEMEN